MVGPLEEAVMIQVPWSDLKITSLVVQYFHMAQIICFYKLKF